MISAPMVLEMLWLHWVTHNDLPEKEWKWLDSDPIIIIDPREGFLWFWTTFIFSTKNYFVFIFFEKPPSGGTGDQNSTLFSAWQPTWKRLQHCIYTWCTQGKSSTQFNWRTRGSNDARGSQDTKRDSLLIFESTPFTEKVLWNCESNWWINR